MQQRKVGCLDDPALLVQDVGGHADADAAELVDRQPLVLSQCAAGPDNAVEELLGGGGGVGGDLDAAGQLALPVEQPVGDLGSADVDSDGEAGAGGGREDG